MVDDGNGCYAFHGRRDRLVKKRGYGSSWARSSRPSIAMTAYDRAAVVARSDDAGVSITAFVALKPGQKRSIIAMKRHCTVYLPNYMVPDTITFLVTFRPLRPTRSTTSSSRPSPSNSHENHP